MILHPWYWSVFLPYILAFIWFIAYDNTHISQRSFNYITHHYKHIILLLSMIVMHWSRNMVPHSRQTYLMFGVWYCFNVTLSPLSDIMYHTWEKYCQVAKKIWYIFEWWQSSSLIGIPERKKNYFSLEKIPIFVKLFGDTCIWIFN